MATLLILYFSSLACLVCMVRQLPAKQTLLQGSAGEALFPTFPDILCWEPIRDEKPIGWAKHTTPCLLLLPSILHCARHQRGQPAAQGAGVLL